MSWAAESEPWTRMVAEGGSHAVREDWWRMLTVECRDLRRVYGDREVVVDAVADVDLEVQEGLFLAVSGASGSGKTTLLNLMAGLDTPTSGSVVVLGTNLGEMSEDERAGFRLRHLGVVFQDNNLLGDFDALENVMLPLQAQGVKQAEARTSAMTAMDRLSVSELAKRRPHQMSGGQRQRVGIARALVGGKTLLLADEPTGALDSQNSESLFTTFQGLTRDGVTVVTVSHDPGIRRFADKVVEMKDGRIAG